jgi:hypothetical protein
MLATLIIVFREVLEAALVVGIVLAASRGVPRRGRWVAGGIAAGVVGAMLVAGFADAISAAVAGIGQELFDATILFAAVAMLGWHNIWMSRHGRDIAVAAGSLGKDVLAGNRPLYALGLVVGIAVLREGSEIVLFLYGIALSSGSDAFGMALGGVLGLALGAATGAALYLGLLAIPLHRLFGVTSFSDAGEPAAVARQRRVEHLRHFDRAQHAGPRAARADRLFGAAGRHPARLLRRDDPRHRKPDAAVPPPARRAGGGGMRHLAVALCLAAAAQVAAAPALADFKVWYPDAEFGETAIESLGDYGHSTHPARSDEQSYTEEIERGVTPFWRTELELEQQRLPGPGQLTNFSQVTSENIFQFTERGEFWLDAGFYAEYGQSMLPQTPNETTFGPVLRKEVLGTIDTVNLFLEKDLGSYAAGQPNFFYAWETRIASGGSVELGFQAYGEPSPNGRQLGDQRLGPTVFGTVLQLGPGSLKWNASVLFGVTAAAPRQTIRWQAEYEIHF